MIEIRTIVFPCVHVPGVSKVVDRARVPRSAYIHHKTGIQTSIGIQE